jgi:hypothetical protein
MSMFVDANVTQSTVSDYFNDEFQYNLRRDDGKLDSFAFGIS